MGFKQTKTRCGERVVSWDVIKIDRKTDRQIQRGKCRQQNENAGNTTRTQALVSDRMTLKFHADLTLYCICKTEKSVQRRSGAWQSTFLHMGGANLPPNQIAKGTIFHPLYISINAFIQPSSAATITHKKVNFKQNQNSVLSLLFKNRNRFERLSWVSAPC